MRLIVSSKHSNALKCNCCNWGHLDKFDQWAYNKITIHSERVVVLVNDRLIHFIKIILETSKPIISQPTNRPPIRT